MSLAEAPRAALTAAPPPAPWLASRSLRLREFRDADRHDIVRMHREPRLRQLLIDDQPLHRHDVAAEFLRRLQALYRRHEGLGIWRADRVQPLLGERELQDPQLRQALSAAALAELAQPRPQFAGWFSLMPMEGAAGEAELGCRLLPGAWGSGLALEGGEQLLGHAFQRLALRRVWALCHPQHRSVAYCVLALGFTDHGVLKVDGVQVRHYAIERDAWLPLRGQPRRDRVRAALRLLRGGAA
jgi:RimJ/RimL family protein N-acetyltransferase